MYLKQTVRYYNGTQQCVAKAPFLIMLCHKEEYFAIIRKVAMYQLGHFMMGKANIKGKYRSVSGSYGNDGLPMDWNENLPKDAKPIPPGLIDAWKHGGGWNSCGNEAPQMRAWACRTFKGIR